MRKAIFLILAASALLLGGTACKKDPTESENAQAQEQAAREAKRQQAAKYYNELIEKYPDSQFAPQARQRLDAIGPVATPAPTAKK